jgi:hypothetical protein
MKMKWIGGESPGTNIKEDRIARGSHASRKYQHQDPSLLIEVITINDLAIRMMEGFVLRHSSWGGARQHRSRATPRASLADLPGRYP